MKILLFNLGSVKNRIIDWEIDGFRSLFEQDTILWGPIPDKSFTYRDKEIPILSIQEPASIRSVFERLPENWFPDIVTCDTSVLNYVPDIYLCPAKTILFTRDAWTDTLFNRDIVEFFDFVNHATIDRKLFDRYHVNLLPLSNCAVSIPDEGTINRKFENREIDVIAIASYNRAFYHERNRILYSLANSNKNRIKIKFFTGIDRPDISSYYQRSKIVLDWAHTLSNRSFEAALNGCLLFSHKDNQLIKDYWVPGEEYIPYDETNLSELISFYLDNPEISKKIVRKAAEKVRVPPSWGQLVLNNINIASDLDVSVNDRIEYNTSIPQAERHFRSATPLLYNYDYSTDFPAGWEELYFKRIDNALASSYNNEFKIRPLIEAARAAFLLRKFQLSLQYLSDLQDLLPGYAWKYYLAGRIHFSNGNYEKSLQSVKKAIEMGSEYPDLLKEYILPIREKGNTCDSRRITSYMWQTITDDKEFQVKSLFHMAYELEGEIFRRSNENALAIDAFCKAIGYVPVPDCIYRVSPLLIASSEFKKLSNITSEGIGNSPYDSILILYKVYALCALRQRRPAFRLLREHERALRSFAGIRKFIVLRNMIRLDMPLVLAGIPLGSKTILKMADVLKKKLGYIYLQ